jgi:hypothetical protein
MANGMYQVRVQDKVFGPFSLAQLAQLRDRGQLHPTYEVSQDGISWEPASTLPGMFAPDATAMPPTDSGQSWMTVGTELKQSGLGITSFAMSILMGLLLFVGFAAAVYAVADAERAGRMPPDPTKEPVLLVGVLGVMAACLGDLVALILGIIALFQSNRKKVFATLGVIFSGLPLAGMACLFLVAAIRQQ